MMVHIRKQGSGLGWESNVGEVDAGELMVEAAAPLVLPLRTAAAPLPGTAFWAPLISSPPRQKPHKKTNRQLLPVLHKARLQNQMTQQCQ